jgi:hypothetical protein
VELSPCLSYSHLQDNTDAPRLDQAASFLHCRRSVSDRRWPRQEARDKVSEASTAALPFYHRHSKIVTGKMVLNKVTGTDANQRSWNLWAAPETVQSIYGYDAEMDADNAVLTYLQNQGSVDPNTKVSKSLEEKWAGWYLPKEQVGEVGKSRL